MSLTIVTDSTSDIHPERGVELGVTVVPLFVVFGDESLRDYIDIGRPEFYDRLRNGKILPTTSQPSAAMFEAAFQPAAQRGDDVLCITISSVLSGTINAARAAAKSFPNTRIELFDSLNAAGGLQYFVEDAAAMASAGASLDEILARLEVLREKTCLFASLPDLSHLQRTGRIGRAQAVVGGIMKILPILSLDAGAVVSHAQVRTFKRAQERILDLACEAAAARAPARLRVMHTQEPQLAEDIYERLLARLGDAPAAADILEAGPVIASHAGPGAIGVFVTSAAGVPMHPIEGGP